MPRSARRVKGGEVASVLAGSLRPGDEIVVRAGEVVPADGEILAGTSSVDESVWSGGAAPVEKTVGSKVVAGTQNKEGELRVRVSAAGDDTALARVVSAVCAGFDAKAARAGVADGLARAYVPALLLTAVGAALIWSWKGPEPRVAHSLCAF